MGGVDLSVFQFDPFLSWSVFFMNGDKTIYGRFGTASPQANRNKRDSNDNHTLAGMKAALEGALRVHDQYVADRETMGERLAQRTGPKPPWRYAEKTPAAKKHGRMKRMRGGKGTCVHCHEVQRTAIDSYFMKKKPLPDRMLWMYPHPEVVGLSLGRDHSARVVSVAPDSAAARQTGSQSGCQRGSISWVMPSSAPWSPRLAQRRSSSAATAGSREERQPIPAKRPGACLQKSDSHSL